MTDQNENETQILQAHWQTTFELVKKEMEASPHITGWKEMAPSPKLFDALQRLKDCHNVLDYGCGSGWAGIILAKSGCPSVTCADTASCALEVTSLKAHQHDASDIIHTLPIKDDLLPDIEDEFFDGLFCSNVLDIIPPQEALDLLKEFSRVVQKGAPVMIAMNYYLSASSAARRRFEQKEGNRVYIDGVLRLVSRTDEEWTELFKPYFEIENLEYFAWPGEEKETRRIFYMRKKG